MTELVQLQLKFWQGAQIRCLSQSTVLQSHIGTPSHLARSVQIGCSAACAPRGHGA